MTENIVYLNGEYLPREQASVSVMDRGFLYGDGVYEVIPVFGDGMLGLQGHLDRLDNSLSRAHLDQVYTQQEWMALFEELLRRNPGEHRAIYLQVTRGVYPKRDLACVEGVTPTVFMMVMQVSPVSTATLESGISAITVDDFRWHACDIKSIALIANVMMKREANDAGATDAILVRDGYVTEGTASNLFIVKDGTIITPPNSEKLLPGITRDLVIDIANAAGLPLEERDIEQEELTQAQEIWLTSSTREIAPVVTLDGRPVADGAAGPVWRKVIDLYQQRKQQLKAS